MKTKFKMFEKTFEFLSEIITNNENLLHRM